MRESTATGDNPLCGDILTISLVVSDALITSAHWEGYGCDLCLDTADRLMDEIKGRSVTEASAFTPEQLLDWYGATNIRRTRKNCVQLPLTVLKQALAALPQD
jgi:NifU-like protein involved in Fe-S cluster formation